MYSYTSSSFFVQSVPSAPGSVDFANSKPATANPLYIWKSGSREALGLEEGLSEGELEGDEEGELLGDDEGEFEGVPEGELLGEDDGELEGDELGLDDGELLPVGVYVA